MDLNLECVRKVLFTIDSVVCQGQCFVFDQYNQYDRLKEYTFYEIIDHIRLCNQEGLFSRYREPYRDVIEIEDTSPKGELLLQTIKAKSNWSTIQTIVMDSSHPALEELIKVSLTIGCWKSWRYF